MTREIKFRGRMKRTKQWMYGDLVHVQDQPCIQVDVSTDEKKTVRMNVDPDSVCQFTGLHDKNGKEIYEGDIVRTLVSRLNATKNKKYRNFVIRYDAPHFWNGYDSILMRPMYMEVIGNIHDNPELLKQEE